MWKSALSGVITINFANQGRINMFTDEQVKKYLAKIEYDNAISCDAATLSSLQLAHLKHIPYENLDILNGVPLSLDPNALYRKMIEGNRGGFCFELQGLYANLLMSIGFSVTQYAGRFLDEPGVVQMRRHRILVVDIQGDRYLCDVGVRSESPRCSVLLAEGIVQTDGVSQYRLTRNDFYGWVLNQKEQGKEWNPIYGFTEEPQIDADYVMPMFFCEKHPDSTFNKFMKISIFTDDSNLTLIDHTYKKYKDARITEQHELKKREEIKKLLYDMFHIMVTEN